MSERNPFIVAFRPPTSSTVPADITGVVLLGSELTVSVAFASPLALDAVTIKSKLPVTLGVPVKMPVAGLKDNPLGGKTSKE